MATFVNVPSTNMSGGGQVYDKNSGGGFEGYFYQLKLAALFLLHPAAEKKKMEVFVELKDAGAFDDVVVMTIDSNGGKVFHFFQLKHKQGETVKHIRWKDKEHGLLSIDGDFSLLKYLTSFQKIKKLLTTEGIFNSGIIKNAVVFTTIGFGPKIPVEYLVEAKFDEEEMKMFYPGVAVRSDEGKDAKQGRPKKHLKNNFSAGPYQFLNQIPQLTEEMMSVENDEKKKLQVQQKLKDLWAERLSPKKKAKTTDGSETPTTSCWYNEFKAEFDDYFQHLIFAIHQPNESEISDRIKHLMKKFVPPALHSLENVYDSFLGALMQWMKNQKGHSLTPQHVQKFIQSPSDDVLRFVTYGSTRLYTEKLDSFQVQFVSIELDGLRNFLYQQTDQQILCVLSPEEHLNSEIPRKMKSSTLITAIKVKQILSMDQTELESREGNSSLMMSVKREFSQELVGSICHYFQSLADKKTNENQQTRPLLVLEFKDALGDSCPSLIQKLIDQLIGKSMKIIIIISAHQYRRCLEAKTNFPTVQTYNDVPMEWNHLNETTQNYLCTSKEIYFQEKKSNLTSLIAEETAINQWLCKLPLFELITEQKLQIDASAPLTSVQYDPDYYIERTLRRLAVVDRSQMPKELKRRLCYSFEDFNSRQVDSYVHWLEKPTKTTNSELFIWRRSSSERIDELRPFVVQDSERKPFNESFAVKHDEDYLLTKAEKVVIIADAGGMGKSMLLTRLEQKILQQPNGKQPKCWIIRINLNDHADALYKETRNFSGSCDEALDFFADKLLCWPRRIHFFAKSLLKHRLRSRRGNVVLMFDGFDEITLTGRNATLGLLRQLASLYGVKRLFVASRPHGRMRKELENKLGYLAFNLKEFTEKDQENYLCKYWKTKLKIFQNNKSEGLIRSFALKAVDKMNVIMKNEGASDRMKGKAFSSIPLQCWILGETLQPDVENYVESKGNTFPKFFQESFGFLEMYDLFWETKCGIFHVEKSKFVASNAPSRDLCLASNLTMTNFFRRLAIRSMFHGKDAKDFWSPDRIRDTILDSYIPMAPKMGLTETKEKGKLKFINRTVAEYFVADYLRSRFSRRNNKFFISQKVNDLIIKKILEDGETDYKGVRYFLDCMLKNVIPDAYHGWPFLPGEPMSPALTQRRFNDRLVQLCSGNVDGHKKILRVAVQEGCPNLFGFMLYCAKESLLVRRSNVPRWRGAMASFLDVDDGYHLLWNASNGTFSDASLADGFERMLRWFENAGRDVLLKLTYCIHGRIWKPSDNLSKDLSQPRRWLVVLKLWLQFMDRHRDVLGKDFLKELFFCDGPLHRRVQFSIMSQLTERKVVALLNYDDEWLMTSIKKIFDNDSQAMKHSLIEWFLKLDHTVQVPIGCSLRLLTTMRDYLMHDDDTRKKVISHALKIDPYVFIHYPLNQQSPVVFQILGDSIDNRDAFYFTSLHQAIIKGQTDIVLNYCGRILQTPCDKKEMARRLIEDECEIVPFYLAASWGLSSNPNVTSLHIIVKFLEEVLSDDEFRTFVRDRNKCFQQALYDAASFSRIGSLQYLLKIVNRYFGTNELYDYLKDCRYGNRTEWSLRAVEAECKAVDAVARNIENILGLTIQDMWNDVFGDEESVPPPTKDFELIARDKVYKTMANKVYEDQGAVGLMNVLFGENIINQTAIGVGVSFYVGHILKCERSGSDECFLRIMLNDFAREPTVDNLQRFVQLVTLRRIYDSDKPNIWKSLSINFASFFNSHRIWIVELIRSKLGEEMANELERSETMTI